jgi:hypothetical protein
MNYLASTDRAGRRAAAARRRKTLVEIEDYGGLGFEVFGVRAAR